MECIAVGDRLHELVLEVVHAVDFIIRNDDFLLVAYAGLQHVEPIIFQAVNGLGEDGIEQPPEDGNLYADINDRNAAVDDAPVAGPAYVGCPEDES